MVISKQPLQVYLFYSENDQAVINSLSERLRWDGVDVHLLEFSALEKRPDDADDSPQWLEKKQKVQDVVQNAHVLMFCLSEGLSERASLNTEWQFVFSAAANKLGGNISILVVRLDGCKVPESFETWNSINLFEADGYKKLMLAVKFHADMEGLGLDSHAGWKTKFTYPESEPEPEEKPKEIKKKRSPLGWIISLGIIVVAAIYLFRTISDPASRTQFTPVEILAENATQNVQAAATNRVETNEARVLPFTQTAAYYISLHLTQTKAEFEAHITPTLTLTPTETITPTLTVTPTYTTTAVPIPVQIIGGGNVPMVLIPQGSFIMGHTDIIDASPVSSVDMKPYYIDQFEVTNTLYQRCVQAGVCPPPAVTDSQTRANYYSSIEYANYPVINVDWYMARTFCEWRDARLPTEAEWEKAARGDNSSNYPWGDIIFCPFANYSAPEGACVGDTQSVDKYEAGVSMYNVYNMSGNVAEWVGSLHLPYPYNAADDRNNPNSIGLRVVRGGSWASPENELLTYYRLSLDPGKISLHGNDLGFRCAKDVN